MTKSKTTHLKKNKTGEQFFFLVQKERFNDGHGFQFQYEYE